MHADPLKLRVYSTAQLIEEVARRANAATTEQPQHWCHDCAKYVCWVDGPTPARPMPDDYNPCSHGHKMRFKMPEDMDDEYGHFLNVCPNRDIKPAPDEVSHRLTISGAQSGLRLVDKSADPLA